MITEAQQHQLKELTQVFLEENAKMNLSAFRDEPTVWIGNVLDSIAALDCPLFQVPSFSSTAEETATPPSPTLPPEGEGSSVDSKNKKVTNKTVLHHARQMRSEPTPAEELLWKHLREQKTGYKFRRQHPIDQFILDFYCHEAKLAIEIDGSIHNKPEEQEWDRYRETELNVKDIRIIRFTNNEVMNNIEHVLETIESHLKNSPLPLGEGSGVRADDPRNESGVRAVLDLGTGGGFPLLPLAICLPDWQFTGLDSTQKKIDAIDRIVNQLGLTNVRLLCGRCEELGHDSQHREQYDIVTARAVAPLNTLVELTSPFVAVGGMLAAWKSVHLKEELEQSLLARSECSLHLTGNFEYDLGADWGKRQLLFFEKTFALNAKYPRSVGVPKKDPIE